MAAVAMSDRMDRVESQLEGQNAKLDLIIRLTEAQDEKIKGLSSEMTRIAPTIKAGEDVVTTVKTLGIVGRWVLWLATGLVAFLWYMQDRWGLLAQIFRRH